MLPMASRGGVQITIAQEGADVVARAVGTLPPASSSSEIHCGGAPGLLPHGGLAPAIGGICLGSGPGWAYRITGPSSFDGQVRLADASSGPLFGINGSLGLLASASPTVASSTTWLATSLANLGLQPGTTTTWQLPGGEEVELSVAPSPLGLLGVASGWQASRHLRRRIRGAV